MKDIIFLGNSKDDLKDFPDEARREAGFQLYTVQSGFEPSDWKPMPSIGSGVREIRIKIGGAFRVVYLATRPEGAYVLHCFQKKSQQTAKHDIALAQARFKQIG
ncbi:MAG: type II toxin-antitoxin system RelE/ParE family toxin [Methylobacter sp.]|jgi:phage-related protein|nr:type II toxin-antitoxin system RelE/ParE family toxin [Methylobacter sp.]